MSLVYCFVFGVSVGLVAYMYLMARRDERIRKEEDSKRPISYTEACRWPVVEAERIVREHLAKVTR